MSLEDDKLDELMARGLLSGPQYDAVLDRVLARTETRPPRRAAGRWLRWALVPAVALASGVGAWMLMVRPAREGFTAKGGRAGPNGALAIGCAQSGNRVCAAGAILVFTVNSAVASGSLGAYAEPLDDPAHGRIWYFPTAAGTSPTIAPGGGTVVVPDGIRIGPEHHPGRYRVTVWISARPLARNDVDRADPRQFVDRAAFDLEVTP